MGSSSTGPLRPSKKRNSYKAVLSPGEAALVTEFLYDLIVAAERAGKNLVKADVGAFMREWIFIRHGRHYGAYVKAIHKVDVPQILKLRSQKMSYWKIADTVGCSYTTVAKICKEAGLHDIYKAKPGRKQQEANDGTNRVCTDASESSRTSVH